MEAFNALFAFIVIICIIVACIVCSIEAGAFDHWMIGTSPAFIRVFCFWGLIAVPAWLSDRKSIGPLLTVVLLLVPFLLFAGGWLNQSFHEMTAAECWWSLMILPAMLIFFYQVDTLWPARRSKSGMAEGRREEVVVRRNEREVALQKRTKYGRRVTLTRSDRLPRENA